MSHSAQATDESDEDAEATESEEPGGAAGRLLANSEHKQFLDESEHMPSITAP
jgi:hypothetical protein